MVLEILISSFIQAVRSGEIVEILQKEIGRAHV